MKRHSQSTPVARFDIVSTRRYWWLLLYLLVSTPGCLNESATPLIGTPAGPYQIALDLYPSEPVAGQETRLTFRITHAKTHQPVSDLQILHERALHTFIVSRNLSAFAHTHHEDFISLTSLDLREANFHFPYTFPRAGQYYIVNEFTHKNRSWIKHFTLTVKGKSEPQPATPDFRQEKQFDSYRVSLKTSPSPPIAGYEVELVCHLATQDGVAVTDLGLYLGTEVHMATWRLDGKHFGHQHTYTADMAALMQGMRGHSMSPDEMARRMVQLMRRSAKQEYFGPDVPLRHIFPAPGIYKLFLEFVPNGEYLAVDFLIEVAEYADGTDTTIHSILPSILASTNSETTS